MNCNTALHVSTHLGRVAGPLLQEPVGEAGRCFSASQAFTHSDRLPLQSHPVQNDPACSVPMEPGGQRAREGCPCQDLLGGLAPGRRLESGVSQLQCPGLGVCGLLFNLWSQPVSVETTAGPA